MRFKFKRKDRAAMPVGDAEFCYSFLGCDYGLASDDSRVSGIPHISVTLNSDGSPPAFTVPSDDLEPQP